MAAALLSLSGCPGPSTTASDSGSKPDAGRDAGAPILCTPTNNTTCTLDAGSSGVCCDGVCVQTENDSANCNLCGQVCPAPSACQSSTCLTGTVQGNCLDGGCPSGLGCAGGFFCATLSCPATEVGGLCALPSGDGGTCCTGTCTDSLSDDHNCGHCGEACVDGGYCHQGACRANPDCGKANAGAQCRLTDTSTGICCGGTCIDLGAAVDNCGTCGSGCPQEANCVDGTCFAADGGVAACGDGGQPCADGTLCSRNRCLPALCSTEPGSLCGLAGDGGVTRGLCCGGTCSDPSSDPLNCGQCGHACTSGFCDGGCLSGEVDAGSPTDGGAG